jgi:hypothetical protein
MSIMAPDGLAGILPEEYASFKNRRMRMLMGKKGHNRYLKSPLYFYAYLLTATVPGKLIR